MGINQLIRPVGTQLKNKYILDKVLGSGDQAITYLANDIIEKRQVAIKEYNVEKEYAFEAVTTRMIQLGKLEGIAQVFDVFDSEGKTYVVMEYIEGVNGCKFLENNKELNDSKLIIEMMLPVIKGISMLHSMDILHREICTDNIMVTPYGEAVLIDFDSVHDNTGGSSINDITYLKKGFSPLELSIEGGKIGVWTDIYEICATLYHFLTKNVPIDQEARTKGERLKALSSYGVNLSELTQKVILNGLNNDPESRITSATDLYNALVIEKNHQVDNQITKVDISRPDEGSKRPIAPVKKIMDPESRPVVPVKKVVESDSFNEIIENDNTNKDKQGKRKGKKIFIIIMFIGIIIALLGVAIIIYSRSNDNNRDSNSQEENQDNKYNEENQDNKEDIVDNSEKEKYDNAIKLINGDYNSVEDTKKAYDCAVAILMELGDYEDSYTQLYDIAGKYYEYSYISDSADVYKYLEKNEVQDSLDKLFVCAAFYVEEQRYEDAKELYEYLSNKQSSEGYKASDGITECSFMVDVNLYNSYNDDSNDEQQLEKFISTFEDYNGYISTTCDANADNIVKECKSKLAMAQISNKSFDKFDDAINYYKESGQYDVIENIAVIYNENGKYDEAINTYKLLSAITGTDYDDQIRICQSNADMRTKYSNFDKDNSHAYDSKSDSLKSYVSVETAEKWLSNIYGQYQRKDDSNDCVNFTATLIDDKKYGVSNIVIEKDGTIIQAKIYYLDDEDNEFDLLYDSSKSEQMTYIDENDETNSFIETIYYSSLTIDDIEYVIYN